MNKTVKKILVGCIAVVMLLTAVGCSGGKYAIKIGEETVSSGVYAYNMALQKSNYLSATGQSDSVSLWNEADEDGATLGAQLQDSVIGTLVNTMLWRQQFKKLGLSFTDAEQKEIEDNIAAAVKAYGSREEFDKTLDSYGLTYDEYVQMVYYDAQMILSTVEYYFGEEGQTPTSDSEIKEYFLDEYVRVKHILISTLDSSGNELSGNDMKEVQATANKVLSLAKAQKTDDFDALIKEYNEDEGVANYPDGYVFTQGEMVEEFEHAAYDMDVGEIRMVKSQYGYHIMKKYSLDDEEFFTDDMKTSMLVKMYNSELEKMLQEWKEDANISYNYGVINKYTADRISVAAGETTTAQ